MTTDVRGLLCTQCGRHVPVESRATGCPRCEGVLQVEYDIERLRERVTRHSLGREERGVWRFRDVLPLGARAQRISLGEGGTYLHRCDRLATKTGVGNLFLKDETINPTGSFIDRGMAVEISAVRDWGVREVHCWSLGNLAVSMSAYAARAGLPAVVTMSENVASDVGKFYQVLAYGARVTRSGESSDAVLAYGGGDDRHHVVMSTNPFFLEGVKTTAYEVMMQLQWTPPDWVVVPMGSGGHITQVWRAVLEMEQLGLLDDGRPRLIGVQNTRCAPIVEALRNGHDERIEPCRDHSFITRDIGVRSPRCGVSALRAIRESNGTAIAVTDSQTIDSVRSLARLEGVFAEPSSATVIAAVGLLVDDGVVDRQDMVVCMVTGMGLKAPEITRDLVRDDTRLRTLLRRVEDSISPAALGMTKRRILILLGQEPLYGYAIRKRLESEFGVRISIPSVYQHLSELVSLGLVERAGMTQTYQGRVRNYYILTGRGHDLLLGLS